MIILGYLFLILHKNKCCGYSLEAPHQDGYKEYQHPKFLWRTGENYRRTITKYSYLASPLKNIHVFIISRKTLMLIDRFEVREEKEEFINNLGKPLEGEILTEFPQIIIVWG